MNDDTAIIARDPNERRERARKYNTYSDAEIAEALAALDANDGNVYATVRQTGIPETTIRQWAKGLCRPIPAELRENAKAVLADHCEAMVWKLLEHADDKYDQMHPSQAIVGAAILIDKVSKLRGEATQVVEHRDDSRRAKFRERYGNRHRVVVVQAQDTPQPDQATKPQESRQEPSADAEQG